MPVVAAHERAVSGDLEEYLRRSRSHFVAGEHVLELRPRRWWGGPRKEVRDEVLPVHREGQQCGALPRHEEDQGPHWHAHWLLQTLGLSEVLLANRGPVDLSEAVAAGHDGHDLEEAAGQLLRDRGRVPLPILDVVWPDLEVAFDSQAPDSATDRKLPFEVLRHLCFGARRRGGKDGLLVAHDAELGARHQTSVHGDLQAHELRAPAKRDRPFELQTILAQGREDVTVPAAIREHPDIGLRCWDSDRSSPVASADGHISHHQPSVADV
mmetsp:Transcript_48278/g.108644  ORF Transcript_48278/g.108644 Transcript_48278/m.108644 type:complete len:268 (+) Transcript_48278:735-1538(+)